MITHQKILNLATKLQTNAQNVINEYFQNLFLSYFYQNKGSEKILFKGGTALRIIYKSPRFSEDLDFSSSQISVSEIEKILLATLESIEKEAIKTELFEAKKTSGGYLGIIKFSTYSYNSRLQFEISFRKKALTKEIVTISSDFTTAYIIASLEQKEMVGEKLEALLSRKKPRDFYDLYFMLRSGLISTEQKSNIIDAGKLIQKTDINFDRELKIFLPKSHWPVIKNFKQVLMQEINKNI